MRDRLRRVGGICIHENKILLMHRINKALPKEMEEYFVVPGGHADRYETIEDACIRELKEETSIDVKVKNKLIEFEDRNVKGTERTQYFYSCDYLSGTPALHPDCEELEEMKEGVHFYKPMWVQIDELKQIKLYPNLVKDYILNNILDNNKNTN